MNDKIEWFFNNRTEESGLEYIGIKSNLVVCRVKREAEFSNFWVARNEKGNYLFRDQYRNDVFGWIENNYGA